MYFLTMLVLQLSQSDGDLLVFLLLHPLLSPPSVFLECF